jgi:hypothetical protein
MTDKQEKWIMDNSTSDKSHRWMLWRNAQEGRKDTLAKP